MRQTRTASALAALVTLFCAISALPNNAAEAKYKAKQVRIEYVRPPNPTHQAIYEQLKQARAIEYVHELLSPIRLPRPLTLSLAGCDGIANAWYSDGAITVCYEFVAEILKNAPENETPAGITRLDAIVGPLLDTFLHEAGHAVFELLKIPVFGREEDAADQFSTYIMLQYDKEKARRLILGSAYQYRVDIQEPEAQFALKRLSDVHGIPAQRFYNVLCISYGADPKLFSDLVEKEYLPQDRAQSCEDEYRQISFAFKALIGPYVDKARAKGALKRRFKTHAAW